MVITCRRPLHTRSSELLTCLDMSPWLSDTLGNANCEGASTERFRRYEVSDNDRRACLSSLNCVNLR